MTAKYIITLADLKQLPDLIKGDCLQGYHEPRIAFVGRSNVGKSSLINSLLGLKLAQTSAEPGKTRKVHFYHWPAADRVLVDLPGYGYARASATDQENWAKFIEGYLTADPNIDRAVVLLDARHGPTPNDIQAIQFISSLGISLMFVFTKCDELKKQSDRAKRRKIANAQLLELGYSPDLAHWVSSHSRDGIKPLCNDICGKENSKAIAWTQKKD